MNAIILDIVFFDKEPIDTGYFVLTEEIDTGLKSNKFKEGDRVRKTKYENAFSYIKIS